MTARFDAHLVNDPFDDPGLYVELVFERRALLFDLGDLSPLPPRKLLRVSDVFVSHMHMDHFAGFDRLLRYCLGREKILNLYGPAGLIDAVGHKLAAYTWNLVSGYEGNLKIRASEHSDEGCRAIAEFTGRHGFRRTTGCPVRLDSAGLLEDVGFCVRARTLDHSIPCLAFAIEEMVHVNIWRNRLEALGLEIGPWLRGLKEAILRGDADSTPIAVAWRQESGPRPATLPLGQLVREIVRLTPGRKIAYVVDTAYTDANAQRIVALAQGSDTLFIETPFLETDAKRAAQRRHLTARQAGTLARRAQVKRLVTLHYSPRYEGRGEALAREAEAAFHGYATESGGAPSSQRS
jgi:ribonuclease Z